MSKFQLPAITSGMNKRQIENAANVAVDNVLSKGNYLEAIESIAVVEQFIKQVKDHSNFKPAVLEELAKYGKSYTNSIGTKIEPMEGGIRYDYSNCSDYELKELEDAFNQLDLKIKERQKFLKSLPLSGIEILTEESELIRIYPPSKVSTSTYKVTISK
jgi:hypothetical protein